MSILIVQKIIDEVLDRANTDGIEAGRNLYSKMFDNEKLLQYKSDVDADLLLEGRDELIVEY
ncbi:hypothetical protein JHD53_05185 [Peptacetobacter hiranonis]|uniref:hypothetical protein n=1 Tax=Peptacetobacter hiranonis TaxID=89152 RepID=UPI001916CEAD|nr:hypothetical protein [Peptacetobacter hiranonis]QQQ87474.1 hypothetical protein JHD53_05185 [Peptacetobacter hiranonis]